MDYEDPRALSARSNALHAHYTVHFAGRPRATRDLVGAEVLVSEAREIARMTSELPGQGDDELRTKTQERLELYETERKAVIDAHAMGLDAARAAIVGTRANLTFARYRRHFAGQDRRTRDQGLMDELIADCEALQRGAAELVVAKAPEGLRKDLEIITENLSLYRRERQAIIDARSSGSPDEQASALAGLANHQFKLYARHFADQSRMSRRSGLLERIVGELGAIQEAMGTLSAQGHGGETNMQNAGTVAERKAIFAKELDQLTSVQVQATAFQRLRALEDAMNDAMSAYDQDFAGKDRASCDPNHLSEICDRMGEVERQLSRLVERFNLGVRHRPTARVRDLVVMMEREYQAIVKARLN